MDRTGAAFPALSAVEDLAAASSCSRTTSVSTMVRGIYRRRPWTNRVIPADFQEVHAETMENPKSRSGIFFIAHWLHTDTQLIGRYMLKETCAGSSSSSSILLVFGPLMGGAVIPLAGRPFVGQVLSGIAVTNLSNASDPAFFVFRGHPCRPLCKPAAQAWEALADQPQCLRGSGKRPVTGPGSLLPRNTVSKKSNWAVVLAWRFRRPP